MAKMKHPKVKINATGYPFISFITSQFGLIQSLPPPKQNLICVSYVETRLDEMFHKKWMEPK
jgi:hypothetical protein